MIRAVITDLDNTLLRSDKSVSARAKRAFEELRRTGVMTVAATARPRRALSWFKGLPEFDAYVLLNGARLSVDGLAIDRPVPRESVSRMLERIPRDACLSMETQTELYSNLPIPEWDPVVTPEWDQDRMGAVYKLLVLGKNSADICRNAMTDDVYMTVAEDRMTQIMYRDATKWKGIQTVLASRGIDPNDAVYFGDDNDDLEPIRMCGTGIAVANAIPRIREAADIVIGTNDEDAVARWLEANCLTGAAEE